MRYTTTATSLLLLTWLVTERAMATIIPKSRAPSTQAVIRLEGAMSNLRLSPSRKLLAFTDPDGRSLRIIDLESHEVIEVTPHRTGPAFFWSPDGIRLFFRELTRDNNEISSALAAYDTIVNRRTNLETIAGSSGYPAFNPFDNNVYLIHEKGISQQRLEFPGDRPSQWQKQKRLIVGNWVASQSAVLWLGELGLSLKKIRDDASGVASFSISPDGKCIAWATQAGKVFTATEGGEAVLIGEGKDPSWHPYQTMLVYAASRRVGTRVIDSDLRIVNLQGEGTYLTFSADLHERWPIWLDGNTLLYTAAGTTDLFRLQFANPQTTVSGNIKPGGL